MTVLGARTGLVPQEIADAIMLPEGYADLKGVVFPACDWLRANAPIAPPEVEEGDRVWLRAKHAPCKEVLRHAGMAVARD